MTTHKRLSTSKHKTNKHTILRFGLCSYFTHPVENKQSKNLYIHIAIAEYIICLSYKICMQVLDIMWSVSQNKIHRPSEK